jgi:uncharacterized RDD family membrane protein YckC
MSDTPGPVPAGLGRRTAARLVDLVLLGAAGLAATSLAVRTLPGAADPAGMEPLPALVLSVALFVLYTGYEVVLTALYGGTVGKLLLKVRITAVAPEPGSASGGVATVAVARRSAVLYASVLLNFVPVVGLLALLVSLYAVVSVFTSPERRGLHDRAGGTAVVAGVRPSVSS